MAMTKAEAKENGVCYWCEANVRGELTKYFQIKYEDTGLCPECWNVAINKKCDVKERAPQQQGLPLIGDPPKVIHLNSVEFGTMVIYRSEILRDCLIKTNYLGPCCTFNIIPPNLQARQEIVDFITGNERLQCTPKRRRAV